MAAAQARLSALTPSARLLPPVFLGADEPTTVTSNEVPAMRLATWGAGAGVAAAGLSLLGGVLIGSLSNNLYAAALPALLLVLIAPPLAVVFAEQYAGRDSANFRKGWPIAATIAAQLLMIVGAITLGVSAKSPDGAILFTLADAAVLTAVATPIMVARSQPKAPALTLAWEF